MSRWPNLTVEERFWRHVDKSGDCWEWTANRNPKGYGRFSLFGAQARIVSAHRLSYELTTGPIPVGMFVCHRCDNPPHLRGECAEHTLRENVEIPREVALVSQEPETLTLIANLEAFAEAYGPRFGTHELEGIIGEAIAALTAERARADQEAERANAAEDLLNSEIARAARAEQERDDVMRASNANFAERQRVIAELTADRDREATARQEAEKVAQFLAEDVRALRAQLTEVKRR